MRKLNSGYSLVDTLIAVGVISLAVAGAAQMYGIGQQRLGVAEWVTEVAEIQSRARALQFGPMAPGVLGDALHASLAPELVIEGQTPAQLAMRIGGAARLEIVERALTVPVARVQNQLVLVMSLSSAECAQSVDQLGTLVHAITLNGSTVLDRGNNVPFNAGLALQGCTAETVIAHVVLS